MYIVIPILIFGVTGIACGGLLAIAARFFAVQEDPRIEALIALLPGANCGACGFPSCGEYARAILRNDVPINLCRRGGEATLSKLAAYLNVAATVSECQTAIVLCQGDDTKAIRKAIYNGIADCSAAEFAEGGSKACRYGCLGLGSCARVCPVGAIEITAGNLAVVHSDICIGCGQCVAACPRHLIKIVPAARTIHILCASKDRGPAVRKICSVGCIACTLCVKKVNNQGITMEGALAVVDYTVPLEDEAVIAVCPRKTIVKLPARKDKA